MENGIAKLQELVDQYDNIVFFGGAGVSTESGIPDFRSVDGLYSQQYTYPPEEMLSHTMFQLHPEEFYRFYRNKMLYLDAKPNAAHRNWQNWRRPESFRCGYPEYRRAPPGGGKPEGI